MVLLDLRRNLRALYVYLKDEREKRVGQEDVTR